MAKVNVIISQSHGRNIACSMCERKNIPFIDLILAFAFADRILAPGLSVTVRPAYNEVDDKGKGYFRIWRSFNGEALKEVRFEF